MHQFVLLCSVDLAKDDLRARLRAEHLTYLSQHLAHIAFGGPMVRDDGRPSTMMIVYRAESREAVDAFIASEPYNRNGVFDRVDIHPWSQVLPETAPGALAAAIASERAK